MSNDELLDIVDSNDNVTGQETKENKFSMELISRNSRKNFSVNRIFVVRMRNYNPNTTLFRHLLLVGMSCL